MKRSNVDGLTWSLHCKGKSLQQIAARLGITEDHARVVIVAKWKEQKEAEAKR